MSKSVPVSIGDQVYEQNSAESFGAVRYIAAHELVINVENFGDVHLAASAVLSVHDGKVVVDSTGLTAEVKNAIRNAHRAEDR